MSAFSPKGVLQVHEIFPEGAVALDGRLQPGDRLLAVNNKPLSNLPYALAVSALAAAFSDQMPLRGEMELSNLALANPPTHPIDDGSHITLLVERPGLGVQTKWYDQEITVDLLKKPGRGLGLCIVERSGPPLVLSNGLSSATNTVALTSTTGASATSRVDNEQPPNESGRSGLGVLVCDLVGLFYLTLA